MAKGQYRWHKWKDRYLKENFGFMFDRDIARDLNVTEKAVKTRADKLKIKKRDNPKYQQIQKINKFLKVSRIYFTKTEETQPVKLNDKDMVIEWVCYKSTIKKRKK